MPEKRTLERARRAKRQGESPSTQAGEFEREEIHHVREGKHGARSTKQAIAIGLSKTLSVVRGRDQGRGHRRFAHRRPDLHRHDPRAQDGKDWGGCPLFKTVLGDDCAKDYFTSEWIARDEWQSGMSGKENMNHSSAKIIAGDRQVTKSTMTK